jgi:hypothetical protein
MILPHDANPKPDGIFGKDTIAPVRIAAWREGLRAVGYREPDQVELIIRVTGSDPSRIGPMASELVERNVDVLVPISPAAVQAVRSLTSTIPIVAFDLETDPVGSGLVKSLARPGDARTTRHGGYVVSQQKRKRIEESFGWGKTIGGLARPMLRGVKKLGSKFTLAMAGYNLIRLPKLIEATA